jgi:hypothetical protein
MMGRVFTLSFVVVLGLFSTAVCGKNLLHNSDFSLSADGTVPGWQQNAQMRAQTLSRTVVDGRACLEILTMSATEKAGRLSQRVPITPGKSYSLTLLLRRDSFVYGTNILVNFYRQGEALSNSQNKTFRSSSWEPLTLVFFNEEADEAEVCIANPNTGTWRITRGRRLQIASASLTEINPADDLQFRNLRPGQNRLQAEVKSPGEYYLWLRTEVKPDDKFTIKTPTGEWTFQGYTPGSGRWVRPILPEFLLPAGEQELILTIPEDIAAQELLLTMDPYFVPEGVPAWLEPGPELPSTKVEPGLERPNGILPLTVDAAEGAPAIRRGITQGVPFPKGVLRDPQLAAVSGRPSQTARLAAWADGSVKWLQVSTVAAAGERLELHYGPQTAGKRPAAGPPLLSRTAEGIRIDTGALQAVIPAAGPVLLQSISVAGRSLAGVQLQLNGASPQGAQELRIEDNGPVRAEVRLSGTFAGVEGFAYTLRVVVYAGCDYLELEPVLRLADGTTGKVNDFSLVLSGVAQLGGKILHRSTEPWQALPAGGWRLDALVKLVLLDGNWQLDTAVKSNESKQNDFPFVLRNNSGALLASGCESLGAVTLAEPSGLVVAVRDFWQNAPKSLQADGTELRIALISEAVDFYTGMARTHNLLLGLGGGTAAAEAFLARPLLLPPAEWTCASGAMHSQPLSVQEAAWPLYEQSVERTIAVWQKRTMERSLRDPQFHKNLLFYGETGYSTDSTNNLETALDEGLILQFLRSGRRDWFTFAEACIGHYADVDINHSDSKAAGHIYVHGKFARTATPHRANGHSWFNGTLIYGFFTASRRILEIADQVGRYHSQVLPAWPPQTLIHYWRQPAWQMMCCLQGWDATGNWDYVRGAQAIAEVTRVQRDHIVSLWPYMFAVGIRALREYYETTGDPEARELYLQLFDGYIRMRQRPHDTSFGEHPKEEQMVLGNYPNDRSCCFYDEASQADRLSGQQRYARLLGPDMTLQLEYGINDPTFLWGSADLLRGMRDSGMSFSNHTSTSQDVAFTPVSVPDSPLAVFACPVLAFQFTEEADRDFTVRMYNRPYRKYSGKYRGRAMVTAPDGTLVGHCPIRTDGFRNASITVPRDGQTGVYSVFIALQDYWRWTIQEIRFDLKQGENIISLQPRYDRMLIDAVCIAKPNTFNPFEAAGRNPADYQIIEAESGILPAGYLAFTDLYASQQRAVRKAGATVPMQLKVTVPEAGVYEFFARIWKGGPDLIEVSVNGGEAVNCTQVHDMENNDYTFWSVTTDLDKATVRTAAPEALFKNMTAVFTDGSNLQGGPGFQTAWKFLQKHPLDD